MTCKVKPATRRPPTRKSCVFCGLTLTTDLIQQYRVGLFYNAVPYQHWKDEVEKWAKEKYPGLWASLEGVERTEYEEGLKFEGIVNEYLV